jgi:hypothetical protein
MSSATRTVLLALLFAAACAAPSRAPSASVPARTPFPLDDDGIVYVEGHDPSYPRVRYLDGQLSANQSCAIRLANKLNTRIPPVYVNGRPVGFC